MLYKIILGILTYVSLSLQYRLRLLRSPYGNKHIKIPTYRILLSTFTDRIKYILGRENIPFLEEILMRAETGVIKGNEDLDLVVRDTELRLSEIFVDSKDAIVYGSYSWSDIIFIYPLFEECFLGEPLIINQSSRTLDNEKNFFSKVKGVFNQNVKHIILETKNNSGQIIYGASTKELYNTVYLNSSTLPYFFGSIINITTNKLPVVLHIMCQYIDNNSTVGEYGITHSDPNANLKIYHNHSDVINLLSYGIDILSSDNPQESYDISIISHLYSRIHNKPIIHFIDSVSNGSIQKKCVEILSISQQKDLYFQLLPKGGNPMTSDIDIIPISIIFAKYKEITGREYYECELIGSKEPDILLICIVAGSSIIEDIILNLFENNNNKISLLKIRHINHDILSTLYSKIPSSVKKIGIVEFVSKTNNKYGPLFQWLLPGIMSRNEQKSRVITYNKIHDIVNLSFINKIIDNLHKEIPIHIMEDNYHSGYSSKQKVESFDYKEKLSVAIKDNDEIIEYNEIIFWVNSGCERDDALGSGEQYLNDILKHIGPDGKNLYYLQLLSRNLPKYGKKVELRLASKKYLKNLVRFSNFIKKFA